jgi:hypothetical protein
MIALGSIAPLLTVLGTSVKGDLVRRVVLEQALLGPDENGYWENPRTGVSLGSEEGVVTAVFLYGLGKDVAQFTGQLPAGLTFEAKQADVRRVLGQPESSGAPDKMPGVYDHAGWDRYDVGGHLIHFTYRVEDGRIDLVTLMPKEPANKALNPTGLRPAG